MLEDKIEFTRKIPELTINWHILEACNYDCYFCYAKFGRRSIFSKQYEGILREVAKLNHSRIDFLNGSVTAENIRINFAGGEPFLETKLKHAIEMAFEFGLNPSFISNGSLVTDDFIRELGPLISVAGFSVDSFDAKRNNEIGRRDNKKEQVSFERMMQIFDLFREFAPQAQLKINTVVCRENINEDLSARLLELRPDRWKALQVIPIHGAEDRGVSGDEFASFLNRHRGVSVDVVPEDNADMSRSYLMIDPDGCFYQRDGSNYLRSDPILEVGVFEALRGVEFDAETYAGRY